MNKFDTKLSDLLTKLEKIDPNLKNELVTGWIEDVDAELENNTVRSVISEFSRVLEAAKSEEEIHKFVANNEIILTRDNSNFREDMISGVLSKFPITPDRIVDFFIFRYSLGRTQGPPNTIQIIELKQPSTKIFVQNGRMSRDLNDAWMECTEASRLLALNYKDVLRRSAKLVRSKVEIDENVPDSEYSRGSAKVGQLSLAPPRLWCEIFIGRRDTLDNEELDTLRALMRNGGISAFTYDHLLDRLTELADRRHYRY